MDDIPARIKYTHAVSGATSRRKAAAQIAPLRLHAAPQRTLRSLGPADFQSWWRIFLLCCCCCCCVRCYLEDTNVLRSMRVISSCMQQEHRTGENHQRHGRRERVPSPPSARSPVADWWNPEPTTTPPYMFVCRNRMIHSSQGTAHL